MASPGMSFDIIALEMRIAEELHVSMSTNSETIHPYSSLNLTTPYGKELTVSSAIMPFQKASPFSKNHLTTSTAHSRTATE